MLTNGRRRKESGPPREVDHFKIVLRRTRAWPALTRLGHILIAFEFNGSDEIHVIDKPT